MKRVIIHIILILVFKSFVCAQENITTDTLSTFLSANPKSTCLNIVFEGTHAHLAADEDNMLIILSVANPQLQMRLLMMPTSICIDPAGKKRQKYHIDLPSALDVMENMETLKPHEQENNNREIMPDINPLLQALNQKGAIYVADKDKITLGFQRFHVEIDKENSLINYYALIPKSHLMDDRKLKETWSLGICSKNVGQQNPPPTPPIEHDMPDSGNNNDNLMRMLQGDIRSWVKFSIDDVNNANLK